MIRLSGLRIDEDIKRIEGCKRNIPCLSFSYYIKNGEKKQPTFIDQIDKEIVEKIALRSKYVSAVAKYKNNETEVRDSKRVEKVIESKKH